MHTQILACQYAVEFDGILILSYLNSLILEGSGLTATACYQSLVYVHLIKASFLLLHRLYWK